MTKKKQPEYPDMCMDTSGWMDGQTYVDGQYGWDVESLWEAAKNLPIYEVPLVGMSFDLGTWDQVHEDYNMFMMHVKLIMDADLSYPIILAPDGGIADGRHRFAKAVVTGCSTVKIQRLSYMPDPTFEFDEEGNQI